MCANYSTETLRQNVWTSTMLSGNLHGRKRNFCIHLRPLPPIAHFLVSSSEYQAKGYADDILITTTPAKDSLLTTTAPQSVWS